MNTALSLPMVADRPCGNDWLISGITLRTALETSSGLATACLMMPTVIAGLPS